MVRVVAASPVLQRSAIADVDGNSAASQTRRERGKRADALRNIEAIIDAATRLLATNPDASVNEIAKAAGVGRVTLYGHFDSRTALVREVAQRAIHNTSEVLATLDLEGDPREALGRLLEETWRLTHRYGAVVIAGSQALAPEDMRRAHDEPAARVVALLTRGRDAGEFRADMPIEWQVGVIQAILHGASLAVHRGEIGGDEAPTLVRDTVLAALAP
ncbi:MAG: TetR/AcrR family transcriptional regulator [Microbacterium sp.]|uniref:TetR/AcrR family transcriptional regulator n=1 Tax=Microbacterium sp. TaxID=51671 RepID=UPI0039E5C7D4